VLGKKDFDGRGGVARLRKLASRTCGESEEKYEARNTKHETNSKA
jgi:hypothetical protein